MTVAVRGSTGSQESEKDVVETGKNTLVFIGRHWQDLDMPIGQLDEAAGVIR